MDLYLISSSKIAESLHGVHNRVALRYLSDAEKIEIEDKLYKSDIQMELPPALHVLIIPDVTLTKGGETSEYYSMLAEFSLSFLSVEGRVRFSILAYFSNRQFTLVKNICPIDNNPQNIVFRSGITGMTVAQWVYVCLKADKSIGMNPLCQCK